MRGKTLALLFLFIIITSLIIPCLGAASKKGEKKKEVNKQREKDKQVKKDIKEYVKKTQELLNGPIEDSKTLWAIAIFSISLVSLSMVCTYLVKWMNSALAIALFVYLELWLYQHVEEVFVSIFWQWYKFQNNTLKTEL
eukprot:Phypoly_transcript_25442.p1 GENE.Phypoly_transcript_25442~~Phypoly_transcript_25442.p1  ORF type:complete len:139 (+),score=26.41 Phypoly_transcript_25442:85-501(+)